MAAADPPDGPFRARSAATSAEAAGILRPGGVLATVDADGPQATGLATAEAAWVGLDRRVLDEATTGGSERSVGLPRRRGRVPGLLEAGRSDDIRLPAFAALVAAEHDTAGGDVPMSCCRRVRPGIRTS